MNDNFVSVVHGDARAVIATFPDAHFDALITDPPYGISLTKNDPDVGRPNWDRSKICFDQSFWSDLSRVLKPGANVVVMGHSKTFARMSVAIEDAGFELVDTLAWIHGQGYPAGFRKLDQELLRVSGTSVATDFVGWGNMLRPAFEPIVLARNLGRRDSLPEVIAGGGVGGFNIDGARLPVSGENRSRTPGKVNQSVTWRVDRPEGKKSIPPVDGRMPSNVLLQHDPDCTAGGCEVGCAVSQVRAQGRNTRGRNEDASRFYQSFYHHPKATLAERPKANGVTGPTVKPFGIMEWLVSLTTRPGQLVLDPFAGTGTTLEACASAGVRAIGIEAEANYLPLIEKRLQRAGTLGR